MNSLIRFYFHIDPTTLGDDEFAKTWGELVFALDYHKEHVMGLTKKKK